MKNFSPLRYPGGKSRAIDILYSYIPKDTKEIVSPFFGGGSFELYCANQNINIIGYDIFNSLVIFWQQLKANPKQLAEKVKNYYPLSKEEFYSLQKKQSILVDPLEIASSFFVLNRASFSGSTLSGGMSINHPRFNENSINKLFNFNISNFSVNLQSFEKTITEHSGSFFYLDPPYFIKNSLYGINGNCHKGFNHTLLRDMLLNEKKWILSYNYCDEILELYKNFNYIIPSWSYGMSKDKLSKEILIFSKDLSI